MNGVSIIICCYNSASRLPETLHSIADQEIPYGLNWELIIVDNNSTDNTIAVAQSEWRKYNCTIPCTIISEKKQGLSFARKAGVENARYDVLIFCDDDNRLEKNYISYACDIMRSNRNAGIAGGKSQACLETEEPSWFDKFSHVYAVGKQMPQTGIANEKKYLTGAGMVIRKEIFDKLDSIGFSSMLSDRKGDSLSSGGDSEICLMALYLGYDLLYDERLQFTHFIPASRLQWPYCVEMVTKGFAYPQIYFAMYDYCYGSKAKNETPSFDNLYRWNRRRQLRILRNEFSGIKNFVRSFSSLAFSKSGNEKEIRVKTALNKFLYLSKHKMQLAADFKKVLHLSKKIMQLKNGTSFFMQPKQFNNEAENL